MKQQMKYSPLFNIIENFFYFLKNDVKTNFLIIQKI